MRFLAYSDTLQTAQVLLMETVHTGATTKQGSVTVRWLLVEAAWRVVRFDPHFRAVFECLASRKGKCLAIAAVARRLLVTIYAMLRDGTTYRWAKPNLAKSKLKQLARTRGGYLEALHAAIRAQRPETELLHAVGGPEGQSGPPVDSPDACASLPEDSVVRWTSGNTLAGVDG